MAMTPEREPGVNDITGKGKGANLQTLANLLLSDEGYKDRDRTSGCGYGN